MNSSSLKPQQSSEEELLSTGPNEANGQGSVRQWTMAEGESAIDSLPNEVLLMIFRLLSTDQLLIAEQVCLRWKSVVNTCFVTTRTLELRGYDDMDAVDEHVNDAVFLKKMKRYGPSLKFLKLANDSEEDREEMNIDWINEIGDAFPNLQSLSLHAMQLMSGSLSVLAVKCCQLTRMEFCFGTLTDEDLGIILKGLPGLKYLKLDTLGEEFGECFRELGTNLDHLRLSCIMMTSAGGSHILSRCRRLQTLKICDGFECNARSFSKFCKESPLQELEMYELQLSKEVLLHMSSLHFLEELILIQCPEVVSDVLIGISRGCRRLKYVRLGGLPLVCDRGVKALAKCRHLNKLECLFLGTMTDKSLFEIARLSSFSLNTLVIASNVVTDRGLTCILNQCRQLKCLDVKYCDKIGDSIVDVAIEIVESRHADALDDSSSGESVAIVATHNAIKDSDYLLKLRMEGERLNRYKDGFSHPLLCLQLD